MGKTATARKSSGLQRALRAARIAGDTKAQRIVVLDMRGISSIADYFVICGGTSDRHVKAVAQHVIEGLKAAGVRCWHSEGWRGGSWVVMDYGDVIVHVFLDEARRYYQLDRLWGDAKVVGRKKRAPEEGRRSSQINTDEDGSTQMPSVQD